MFLELPQLDGPEGKEQSCVTPDRLTFSVGKPDDQLQLFFVIPQTNVIDRLNTESLPLAFKPKTKPPIKTTFDYVKIFQDYIAEN